MIGKLVVWLHLEPLMIYVVNLGIDNDVCDLGGIPKLSRN